MITITNLTKKKTPEIGWQLACEKILGKKYRLSIVLAGDSLMKKINSRYRNKKESANVLSFLYSSGEGEIFLNLEQGKNNIFPLFVHGLLHLKGYKHGDKMETLEKKYYTQLKKTTKYKTD